MTEEIIELLYGDDEGLFWPMMQGYKARAITEEEKEELKEYAVKLKEYAVKLRADLETGSIASKDFSCMIEFLYNCHVFSYEREWLHELMTDVYYEFYD